MFLHQLQGRVERRIILPLSNRVIKSRLQKRDFTVVSNNCWGSHIYQRLGVEYQTPFIGLFFEAQSYLKLLSKFRWAIHQEIEFIGESRFPYIEKYRRDIGVNYPIGLIDNEIEIQFLHYSSPQEALGKWQRRVQRISEDDDNLFIKFDDRDECTPEQIQQFDGLPFKNKVCFVSKPYSSLDSTIFYPTLGDGVPDGVTLSQNSYRYFDAVSWINGAARPWKWPLLNSV